MSERIQRIRQRLQARLSPESLEIADESHLHAGHPGARSGKGHFAIRIVSRQFAGQAPLRRHRLIYEALGEMMATDIHALRVEARTPEEIAAEASGRPHSRY